MCGRFTLSHSGEAIAEAFELDEVPRIDPHYNIAPTQPAPVIRVSADHPKRQFTYLYWGLIPSWAKDPKIGARLINARAETVTEKPSFRAAFKRRRCLVVADGFYEWRRSKQGGKQPYYFYLDDHQPFGFAGLWEHWEDSAGNVVESCAILTTVANETLRPIHDRMPVIVDPKDYELWLDPTVERGDRLQAILRPYANEAMKSHPVSSKVNSPRSDSPECIQPLDVQKV